MCGECNQTWELVEGGWCGCEKARPIIAKPRSTMVDPSGNKRMVEVDNYVVKTLTVCMRDLRRNIATRAAREGRRRIAQRCGRRGAGEVAAAAAGATAAAVTTNPPPVSTHTTNTCEQHTWTRVETMENGLPELGVVTGAGGGGKTGGVVSEAAAAEAVPPHVGGKGS